MTEMEWILMESKIANLVLENNDLQQTKIRLQAENNELQERLKKYENRIFDLENISFLKIENKIGEAKCELSDQYSLKMKRLEKNLEDQFSYITKYIENYRRPLYEFIYILGGFTILATVALIITSLLQIFHKFTII